MGSKPRQKDTVTGTEDPNHDRRWLILGVIAIAQLMVVLDVTIVNIALPSAQDDVGLVADRGSGLVGLKDRVEALGGRISVQSVPGAGTSVFAELPFASERRR
jgi:glucose-6-phosphate-specific signal transduction histidine kinase